MARLKHSTDGTEVEVDDKTAKSMSGLGWEPVKNSGGENQGDDKAEQKEAAGEQDSPRRPQKPRKAAD